MMKKLKIAWLFLSLMLAAGMASCSADDTPAGVEVSEEDIIGTWEASENSWTNSEGDSGRNDPKHMEHPLQMKSDGTASFLGDLFRWVLSKGTLTLSDHRGRNIRVVVLSYTGAEIHVSYDCTFESEMYAEKGTYTFRRM